MPHLDILKTCNLLAPIRELIEAAPMPGLGESPTCLTTGQAIEKLTSTQGLHTSFLSRSRLAGLWLLAGELDRSHEISQTLDDATGSYWHGIMHRREGDYSNAKYWMRRTSGHPVLHELTCHLQEVSDGSVSSVYPTESTLVELVKPLLHEHGRIAASLVDLCELACTKRPQTTNDLQLICWWEWQLLFQHS